MRFPVLVCVVAMSLSGCVRVRSSAVPTGTGRDTVRKEAVRVRALSVPAGAQDLGLVEAHASRGVGLPEVIEEFRKRVGALGGNLAKVDQIKTTFETQMQMYSYQCGKATCSGMRPVEVATLSVLGHAYLAEMSP